MRLIAWLSSVNLLVIHTTKIDGRLRIFLVANGVKTAEIQFGNNNKSGLLHGIWRALITAIQHRNALFIVWAHHQDSNRWLQLTLAILRCKFVLAERLVASDASAFVNSRLSIPIKRFVAPRARAVVLNAYSQVNHYRALFHLPAETNVIVVPNSRPVNAIHERVMDLRTNSTALREELGLADKPTIVCVGRLCEQKNQASLITAMAHLQASDTQLVLIGDGPSRLALEQLAVKVAPGQVTFAFYQVDPIIWLAAADMFVLPSLTEGLPGALIEAMAAELPCIATNIPGNRELISDGETGILVTCGSPEELAQAITKLFVNTTTARKFAAAGLQLVREKYGEGIEKAKWQDLLSAEK